MDTNKAIAGEKRWCTTCNEQAWSDASKITHLEGFVREKGLFDELAAYAEKAAAEENGDVRLNVLEGLGYEFSVDPDQSGLWSWKAPTDGCDVSFATKKQAVDSAWTNALLAGATLAHQGTNCPVGHDAPRQGSPCSSLRRKRTC